MDEYTEKLRRFIRRDDVRLMQNFSQHKTSNTLAHVTHVAEVSHRIVQKLHMNVDEDSMMRGAVLHDYYLYDFRTRPDLTAYRHGTGHPEIALENASREFTLNDKERNIIYSHMWPLTLTHLPKCREAWVVSVADKVCAIDEMYVRRISSAIRRGSGDGPAVMNG